MRKIFDQFSSQLILFLVVIQKRITVKSKLIIGMFIYAFSRDNDIKIVLIFICILDYCLMQFLFASKKV